MVSIPISANFDVAEETVDRLRYELRMPKSIMVLDYLPKSRSAAEVRALTERTVDDRQTQVHVEYGGAAKSEFNVFGARFTFGGGAERRSDEFTQVKTDIQVDRLPPRKQVATRKRGRRRSNPVRPHRRLERRRAAAGLPHAAHEGFIEIGMARLRVLLSDGQRIIEAGT